MRDELIAAGLWDAHNSNDPGLSVTAAWQILARIGAACRYAGRTGNGDYEYQIYHPETGAPIALGRGTTAALAMCQAALKARQETSAAN